MLALSSTVKSYQNSLSKLKEKYYALMLEYNEIVYLINKKGGRNFINNGILLSKEDLKVLVILCHPDKHNNSKRSIEVTKVLNKLKGEMK